MCRKIFIHPFLYSPGNGQLPSREAEFYTNCKPVKANRHHLYPRNRTDVTGINKEKFILRLWEYKHFRGWNSLFQFCYYENNCKKCSELTIDEILTLMAIKHPFIANKVGSREWKILFKKKNLQQAFELLCRMLSWKFDYEWRRVFPVKINLVYKKAA